MSDLTKLVRATGLGGVLNAIEGVESAARKVVAAPTAESAGAVVTAAGTLRSTVAAATPTLPTVATVAIKDVGSILGSVATTFLAAKLGPAAPIAEDVVGVLITDFQTWLTSRL